MTDPGYSSVTIDSHGIDIELEPSDVEALSDVNDILGGRPEQVTDLRTGKTAIIPTWPRPLSAAEQTDVINRSRYRGRRRR